MDAAQCAEQMRQLAAAGFGGAYLHARLGMSIEFMSKAYLDAVESSVRAAIECGIRAHLYDEDRWPSGWAGGAVPLADPNYRVKALIRRQCDEGSAADQHSFAEADGFRYCIETLPLGHPKFNGTSYADVTNSDAIRCFLDHAYEPLRHRLGDAFGRAAPTIFTDEPALTYLYSWPEGGLPWSDQLPERFLAATGTKLTDSLSSLFEDLPNSAAVRVPYYRILAELFVDSFMRPIHDWCRRHDIRWTGHFMYEHSLPLHFSWSANGHSAYQHFDWPGVDHLGRQVGEVVTAIGCRSAVHQFRKERMMSELYGASGQHLSFADRKWIGEQQIALGVNHLVPHLVSTTLRGPRKRDYPPTISAHQPWWPVNHVVEDHLARLCEVMSDGSPVTDLLLIHPQESVYALSRGPVAVGNADTWVGRFFHAADREEIAELDRGWKRLCNQLLGAGYVFDFGDEAVLAEHGRIIYGGGRGPSFQVGAAQYRAVLLPPLVSVRSSTLKLLTEFVRAGGLIVLWGPTPQMVDGRTGPEEKALLNVFENSVAVRCTAGPDPIEQLLPICPPEIHITSPEHPHGRVWRYTKRSDRCEKTFLVNLDRRHARDVTVRWKSASDEPITVWHTHSPTSESEERDHGQLELLLPPGGSAVLVEGKLPALVPMHSTDSDALPTRRRMIDVESLDWKAVRLDENAFVIDHGEFRLPGESWQGPYPVLAIKEWLDERLYMGPVDLRYEFAADFAGDPPGGLQLIVEGIEHARDLRLNAAPLDTRGVEQHCWLDPHWHPVDLPPSQLGDRNHIEFTIPEFRFADPGSAQAALRTGSDVEPLMILGDFSVDGDEVSGPQNWEGQVEYHTETPLAEWLPRQPLRYFSGPFVLRRTRRLAPGDVTVQGLPFYAGRLRYDAELPPVDGGNEQVVLRWASMSMPVATVELNGVPAGCFAWAPFEIDITPLMEPGQNRVSVTLYHSLRNLLGPHHHPEGEPVYVNPASFRPEGCANWLEATLARKSLPRWIDRYGFVEFGLGPQDDGSRRSQAESHENRQPGGGLSKKSHR